MAPTTPAKTPSKIKPKSSNGKRQKKGDDNGKANGGAETKTSPTRMGSRSNRKKTKETTPSVKFDLKKNSATEVPDPLFTPGSRVVPQTVSTLMGF